jgi:hypothetical protein
MARIRIDINKLKVLLYKEFDMSFSRSWDDLPEYVQEHWTKVANDVAQDLIIQGIVEIIE